MAMSQKDYIAFAKALKGTKPTNPESQWYEQWVIDIKTVATVCGERYQFKRSKFLEACGYDGD